MWIWIANKFAKFHAKGLNRSENIPKCFRGLLLFETPYTFLLNAFLQRFGHYLVNTFAVHKNADFAKLLSSLTGSQSPSVCVCVYRIFSAASRAHWVKWLTPPTAKGAGLNASYSKSLPYINFYFYVNQCFHWPLLVKGVVAEWLR